MKYDIDYFISKFQAIPEEKWCVGEQINEDNQRCALGQCYPAKYTYEEYTNQLIPEQDRIELRALLNMFPYITTINNGFNWFGEYVDLVNKYIQPTPKQRVWGEFCEEIELQSYVGEPYFNDTLITFWFTNNGINSTTDYNFRNLYDYFDGLGLGIFVTPAFNQDAFCGYRFNIMNKYDYDYDNHSQDFVNRPEAEWNAFYNAFTIREQQLGKGKE